MAAQMPPEEGAMSHRAPPRHGAPDLLLAVAVAAAALGLGSVVTALTVSDPPPAESPIRRFAASAGRNAGATPGPGEQVRPASSRAMPAANLLRSQAAPVTTRAPGRSAPPFGSSTQPPGDEDPRADLAQMTAVQHGRGLPLPGEVGRLQSLIASATPLADNTRQRRQSIAAGGWRACSDEPIDAACPTATVLAGDGYGLRRAPPSSQHNPRQALTEMAVA
jgi:hypothetical protein